MGVLTCGTRALPPPRREGCWAGEPYSPLNQYTSCGELLSRFRCVTPESVYSCGHPLWCLSDSIVFSRFLCTDRIFHSVVFLAESILARAKHERDFLKCEFEKVNRCSTNAFHSILSIVPISP